MYYVGIDFGTTNSSIAVMDGDTAQANVIELEGGYAPSRLLLRTVLYFSPDGSVEAEETSAFNDSQRAVFSLKRHMMYDSHFSKTVDGVTYTAEQLVALFLTDLLKRARINQSDISRLVLSVPTHYNEDLKSLMEKACGRLGIPAGSVWFIDEPIAVLWDYKDRYSKDEIMLIFDFGGGTLDLAVMNKSDNAIGVETAATIFKQLNKDDSYNYKRGKILAKKGLVIGGDDVDIQIIKFIVEEGKKQENTVCQALDLGIFDDKERLENLKQKEIYPLLKKTAERIKVALSEQESYSTTIPPLLPVIDRVGIRGITLTREEFVRRCEPLWQSIEDGLVELNRDMKANGGLGLEQIDAVLLSGGSSLIPHVQDLLERIMPNAKLGMDKQFLQTSICRGNARYSYQDGEILVDDQVNAAYGIYNHHDKDTVTVIKETDAYPIEIKKRVATVKPNQEHIEIIPMVRKGSGFEPLVKVSGPIYYRMRIKPSPRHRDLSRISVTFKIDKAQKLKISAYDNLFKEVVGVEEVDL